VNDERASRSGCLSDAGSAIIEVAFLGVLVLIPLVYLLIAVFDVQRSAFALTAAAREAARVYVDASSDRDGGSAAAAAVDIAAMDHGLPPGTVAFDVTCTRTPCLTPGGSVTVRLHARVALPGLAALGTGSRGIDVRTEHSAVVDRFRAARP
jgi:hypothetical protein